VLCLLLVERKRKKKRKREKQPGGFFPKARHSLLDVLRGIFMAVRCN
jgi:hypothetical protein